MALHFLRKDLHTLYAVKSLEVDAFLLIPSPLPLPSLLPPLQPPLGYEERSKRGEEGANGEARTCVHQRRAVYTASWWHVYLCKRLGSGAFTTSL